MNFRPDLKKYFLRPGELIFVQHPSLIRTILGSCVTITMFCKRTGTAAACHPVLPACRNIPSCRSGTCTAKFKYVECIVPEMIRRFRQACITTDGLEVKLFGGADLLVENNEEKRIIHIGRTNVQMAWKKLNEMNLTVQSYDVEGNQGRKLFFDTSTGEVWLKRFRAETDLATGTAHLPSLPHPVPLHNVR